jgi:hypothetical protein
VGEEEGEEGGDWERRYCADVLVVIFDGNSDGFV